VLVLLQLVLLFLLATSVLDPDAGVGACDAIDDFEEFVGAGGGKGAGMAPLVLGLALLLLLFELDLEGERELFRTLRSGLSAPAPPPALVPGIAPPLALEPSLAAAAEAAAAEPAVEAGGRGGGKSVGTIVSLIRSAYLNVLSVWSALEEEGDTVAIITVLALARVKESLRTSVSFEPL
jgi:hypothetical protein